ncbi:MAG TPA: Gldg family protein, partial [bacterium]|nr:Gldg family protein [bacterium]
MMTDNAKQQRKARALSGAMAVLTVLAIIIVANMIAARHDLRVDTTSNQRFTLSEQSGKILEALTEPLHAYNFVRESDAGFEPVVDLLEQYGAAGRRFSFSNEDLDKSPQLARKFDVTSYQTIVLEYGDRFRKVTDPTEHAVTNAILRLTRDERQKVVYFTRGAGELDIDSFENDGLAFLKMALNDANYETRSINLMTVDTVPEDCDVLAVIRPVQAPVEEIPRMIREYVRDGGNLFIALEPDAPGRYRELLAGFGLDAEPEIVIDPKGYQNLYQPIVETFQDHEITEGFDYGLVFFEAGPVFAAESGPRDRIAMELGLTSADAWTETDFEALKTEVPENNPGTDRQGPIPIIALSFVRPENPDDPPANRVLAIGDADVTSNIFFQTFAAHAPFILNSFHWLADERDLIAIPPKKFLSQPLLLNNTQLAI